MDFVIYTNTRFRVGIDIYPRMYQAVQKRNGLIRIRHIRSGFILFDNLSLSDIQVEGVPAQNLNDLQTILYNRSCECSDMPDEGVRIFDLSFDPTFE